MFTWRHRSSFHILRALLTKLDPKQPDLTLKTWRSHAQTPESICETAPMSTKGRRTSTASFQRLDGSVYETEDNGGQPNRERWTARIPPQGTGERQISALNRLNRNTTSPKSATNMGKWRSEETTADEKQTDGL